jgi:hypothetical protein
MQRSKKRKKKGTRDNYVKKQGRKEIKKQRKKDTKKPHACSAAMRQMQAIL